MLDFLISLSSFIFAIAILVAIHEWGHFQVARWVGVKVLKFSIGFGKPLLKRQGKDGVEYVIAAIPLGGYVKMLDDSAGPVAEADQPYEFNSQPVWKRIAIVSAGPLANFIFAISAFAITYMIGVSGLVTMLDQPVVNSVADKAGLQRGDVIVQVGDAKISTWKEIGMPLVKEGLSDQQQITLTVKRDEQLVTTQLNVKSLPEDPIELIKGLGLKQWLPAKIGEVSAASPAAQAGLKPDDLIIKMDNQPVDSWLDWTRYVRSRPLQDIKLEVLRNGQAIALVLRPGPHPDDPSLGQAGVRLHDSFIGVDQASFGSAWVKGVTKTWDASVLTLQLFGRMIVGRASLEHIQGPIGIAQHTGYSARDGLVSFISLLALISLSLGIINLMPVPVLDGGHLLYYLIEIVKGSPLSPAAQIAGRNIGLMLILMLMVLAFYNDINRLL